MVYLGPVHSSSVKKLLSAEMEMWMIFPKVNRLHRRDDLRGKMVGGKRERQGQGRGRECDVVANKTASAPVARKSGELERCSSAFPLVMHGIVTGGYKEKPAVFRLTRPNCSAIGRLEEQTIPGSSD